MYKRKEEGLHRVVLEVEREIDGRKIIRIKCKLLGLAPLGKKMR